MSKEYKRIKNFLLAENIDTFSAIKAENLRVINKRIMPEGVKNAVMFLIPYYTGEHKERNVSLYAVSRDYHLFVKELSVKFTQDKEHFYYFFADTSPINERDAAIKSGLGFKGQNGLVINEKYGSFMFIGTILTNAVFDEDEYVKFTEKKICMSCGLCKKSCAFLRGESEYCLSELNQRKNVTDKELEIIRSNKILWGCDICQEVCPHNKNVSITPIEFFHGDLLAKLDLEMIENMPKNVFSQRAFSWRGKKTISRNLGKE